MKTLRIMAEPKPKAKEKLAKKPIETSPPKITAEKKKPVPTKAAEEEEEEWRRPRLFLPKSAHMNDGSRYIDFVLSFQPLVNKHRRARRAQFRQKFELEMRNLGLELEHEPKEKSPDGKTAFVKVHASWIALSRQAEFEELQMPVKKSDLDPKPKNWSRLLLVKVFKKNPMELPGDLRPSQPDFFTESFTRQDCEDIFMLDDPDTFFSQSQRIYLTWSIIKSIQVKLKIKKKVRKTSKVEANDEEEDVPAYRTIEKSANIQYLLSEGVYTNAYPIHDSDFNPNFDDDDYIDYSKVPVAQWPARVYLYEAWAKWKRWRYYQPLDEIRWYYGEKIGIYFAWLGFYTHMLILPSIVGVIVLLLGVYTSINDPFTLWFCIEDDEWPTDPLTFCRQCRYTYCGYQSSQELCYQAQVSMVFDNFGAVFYSLFMSVWVVCFLQMWIRYQAAIRQRWDVSERELTVEQVRPDYNLKVLDTWINPVTKDVEPHMSHRDTRRRLAASLSTVGFCVGIVLALLIAVMSYKSLSPSLWYTIMTPVSEDGSYGEPFMNPNSVASYSSSLLNGICIALMTKIYDIVCLKLTRMEMPRTEAEFESSYTYKMFAFQFVNFYGALFYLSFVRVFADSNPNSRVDGLAHYVEVPACPPNGCLWDVAVQLCMIMVGKQILNNVLELGKPLFRNRLKKFKTTSSSDTSDYTRWEKDFDLENPPHLPLFQDYLEMLIQFGFVTMYVPSFPIAPLFALINNVLEIRLDAFKLLTQQKRYIPCRANSIGSWFHLLQIISSLAVFTNAMLIAFTSGFVDRYAYDLTRTPPVILSKRDNTTVLPNCWMDGAIAQFNTSSYCNASLYYTSETRPRSVDDPRTYVLGCYPLTYLDNVRDEGAQRTLQRQAFIYVVRHYEWQFVAGLHDKDGPGVFCSGAANVSNITERECEKIFDLWHANGTMPIRYTPEFDIKTNLTDNETAFENESVGVNVDFVQTLGQPNSEFTAMIVMNWVRSMPIANFTNYNVSQVLTAQLDAPDYNPLPAGINNETIDTIIANTADQINEAYYDVQFMDFEPYFDQDKYNKTIKVNVCHYKDYKDDDSTDENLTNYYVVFMFKLAFVVIFEHFILLVQSFLRWLIPDTPDFVIVALEREEYLQRQWFNERELGSKQGDDEGIKLDPDDDYDDDDDDDDDAGNQAANMKQKPKSLAAWDVNQVQNNLNKQRLSMKLGKIDQKPSSGGLKSPNK